MYLNTPLADRVRPRTLDEVVGQPNLAGEKGILRKILGSGNLPSMIFFGPPGCGKSTIASIIAEKTEMTLHKLNATSASLSDIKAVVSDTRGILGSRGVLLYLDEIQYFNKKQQQSLLEFIEDGRITLIASTTENPYYYIYDALLSRCMVFEFRHVPADDIRKRLRDVLDENYPDIKASDSALKMFSEAAGGDVRRALNMLEAAINNAEDGEIPEELAEAIIPSNAQSSFDRDGDVHYDLLSCLQKSIRGSDPDAAVFYLARLLEGGDLISPCRRLMVIASEDIGPAYTMAPVIVKACIDCARELGMPEARIPLANAAIILATAPKSNSAICAYDMAAEDIHSGLGSDIPLHLRSPLFKGYKYPHDYPGHWVKQQYLPDTVKDRKYYVPGENKFEKSSKEYLDSVKKSEK